MKVKIDRDEWCPVYSVEADDDPYASFEIDVDADTAERWKRVSAEFSAVQAEIRKAVGE